MSVALRKIETAERVALAEDQWRIVALYLQTNNEMSPLEKLFLSDLLAHWHNKPLTDRQEKQLMSMYHGIVGDYEYELDEDEEADVDEVIVRKFLGQLH